MDGDRSAREYAGERRRINFSAPSREELTLREKARWIHPSDLSVRDVDVHILHPRAHPSI